MGSARHRRWRSCRPRSRRSSGRVRGRRRGHRRRRAWSRSRARRPSRAVRAGPRRRCPRPRSEGASRHAAANDTPHPARLCSGGGGVDRVVDQVAHERHRVDGAQTDVRGASGCDVPPTSRCRARRPATPCRGAGRRRSRRPRVRAATWSTSAWLCRDVSVRMLDCLVGSAELDQRDSGVHAIAVLVSLCAQRLAERAHGLVRTRRRRAPRSRARSPAIRRVNLAGERAPPTSPTASERERDGDDERKPGEARSRRSMPP